MAQALHHQVQKLVHRSPLHCERWARQLRRQEWVRDQPRPQVERPIAALGNVWREERGRRKFNQKRTVVMVGQPGRSLPAGILPS